MNPVYEFIDNFKKNIKNELKVNVFDYRIDFSEKKLDDLLSFGEINFLMIYPERVNFALQFKDTNIRKLVGFIGVDYYLVYNITNIENFLGNLEKIGETINNITSDIFIITEDLNFVCDEGFIAGILVRHAHCSVKLESYTIGDKQFCSIGEKQ